MKAFLVTLIIILNFISCKQEKEKKEGIKTITEVTDESPKTYAELSIREGGKWVGKKYEGGTFKNVEDLTLPETHTDHSYYIRYEGPGWENSQVGYRLYLDWRNAIDIFGKKVDSIVLPYVGQDNFDSYHEPSPWGQDILKAGKSLGIGGYGRVVNDTVAHFRKVASTTAKVANDKNKSTVSINYKEWNTNSETIDLDALFTIYPIDRFTKVTLTPSKEIEGICTGIVKFKEIPLIKKEESTWGYIATYGTQTLAKKTDNLGMVIFYKLNEVAMQKEGKDDHLILFKPAKNVTYYFLGAWDQEPNGITNKATFIADINTKLNELESNNILN